MSQHSVRYIRQLGPAMSLGSVAKSTPSPTSKAPCTKKHRWIIHRWWRRCTRCGLEEDRKPAIGGWG